MKLRRLIAAGILFGGSFSVAKLFSRGEQGVWYDPSDFSTMYQDSAGTTPVTAVEDPVGLILDKSGRGNHATQATAASRPTLSARVNLLLDSASMGTQDVTTVALPYTLQHTGTGTITLSGTSTDGPLVGAGTLTFTPTAGTLTLTVTGTVTNAQLETGSTATRYQAITTATSYDTGGFPYYLKFDGVDDSLATASIDFSAGDKMTVFAGVRKLSDVLSVAAELSVNAPLTVGSFYFATGNDTGVLGTQNSYTVASRGSATFAGGTKTAQIIVSAPDTAVISSANDISGDLSTIRRNAVAGTNATGDKGTGNFGNYPLHIGRRNNATLPFNGHLYSLIVRGAQSTNKQITGAEKFVALKTGVSL